MDIEVSAFSIYSSKKKKAKKNNKKKLKSILKPSTNEPKRAKVNGNIPKPTSGVKKNIKNKCKKPQNKGIMKAIPQYESELKGNIKQDDDSKSSDSNLSFDFTPVQTHSVEEGIKVFKWLIAPCEITDFLKNIWEKKAIHITRNAKVDYYKGIISTPLIDEMLRNQNILFGKNIDITLYSKGERETHNPPGRAHPHIVWDYYLNGCSVRLLNPQTFMPRLHLINATLQEFTHSFVGANAYLTPPDSQGFAPHYDDIEAFILQVEGKKHWRVYQPRTSNEQLPRFSSKNFDQSELGQPIIDVVLNAGDLLYFPRGFIHQALTINGEHSLHVTISMFQNHSWADLFEKAIPAALSLAIQNDVSFRKGLPFDIYQNFGLVNSDLISERRNGLSKQISILFDKIKKYLPIDHAVDDLSLRFHHDALPPVLSDSEKAVTIYGDSDIMIKEGKVINRVELEMDSKVRLLRSNILRMVQSEQSESLRIYYYTENSLEYHAIEPQFIEIEEEFAPIVECLIKKYPEYVAIDDLVGPDDEHKFQMAKNLWEKGLIMTEYPLPNIEE